MDPSARPAARGRDPEARFPDGSSALVALHELSREVPRTQPLLPAAIVQSLGRAETLQSPIGEPLAGSRRSGTWLQVLELALLAGAVGLLAIAQSARRSPGPPPAGMLLIDVGRLEVGRDLAEIERECRAIGAGCDRKQMMREVPRTEVDVAPFFLDRDEVTNEAFAEMLNIYTGVLVVFDDDDEHYPRFVHRNEGTGGSGEVILDLNARRGGIEYSRETSSYRARPGREKRPATQMSWFGAALYCESRGKRLPTENEWEAAARGGEDRPFPWGDAPLRCGEVVVPNDGQIAMPAGCPASTAERPVGSAAQDVTPDGVRDLAGNVAEWTSSRFVEGDRSADPSSGPSEMPRVIRGGSWGESLMARSSGRNRRPPSVMGANLGLRCAADIGSAQPGR